MDFLFEGDLPASKSLLNRWLLISSYANAAFKIQGDSLCDDVLKMRVALEKLKLPGVFNRQHDGRFDCGASAAVLRFLAMRLSRIPGSYELIGSPRLFERRHETLYALLAKLGVELSIGISSMVIDSSGWKEPKGRLELDVSQSSQFASALLLNAWDLDFDLSVELSDEAVSESYFEMSLGCLRQAGMQIEISSNKIDVAKKQLPGDVSISVECDVSSAFAVAALAVLSGRARISNFPEKSSQPDVIFLKILNEMGVEIHLSPNPHGTQDLVISRSQSLKGIRQSLKNAPDLLPVLSVLCAFAVGETELFDLFQQEAKESNRLLKSAELVNKLNRKCEVGKSQLKIFGRPLQKNESPFYFDADEDHRMAMAALVAKRAGIEADVFSLDSLSKSFPEFREISKC